MREPRPPVVLGDPSTDFMTPEERLDAVATLLAKGTLRFIEKRQQEEAKDRAFGESIMGEVAALPGGQA